MIKRDKFGRFVKGNKFSHSKTTKKKIGLGNSKPNPNGGKILKKLYEEGKLKINNMFKEGHKAWNKGLTKEIDARVRKTSEKLEGIKKSITHIKNAVKTRRKNNSYKQTKEAVQKIKKARAKQKTNFTSSIEVKIQNFLKTLGIEFFTHVYIKIPHAYQCDILIPSMNLVIECDGDFIHCNPIRYSPNFVRYPSAKKVMTAQEIWDRDKIRTKELVDKGFKVLRLWEFEIKKMSVDEFRKLLNNQST